LRRGFHRDLRRGLSKDDRTSGRCWLHPDQSAVQVNQQIHRPCTPALPNVIMLARLALLESERRSSVLEGRGLRRVLIFRKRLPMMHRDGWQGKRGNNGMAFCWVQWRRGYRGEPVLRRISWEDDRDRAPTLGRHGRPNKGSQVGSQIKRGANRPYVL